MSSTPSPAAEEVIGAASLQGLKHHQAGDLEQAETFYRAILDLAPTHAGTNHKLGVLAVQLGQAQAGLTYFRAALESNPQEENYWLAYLGALYLAGQTKAAQELLELGRKNPIAQAKAELTALWLTLPRLASAPLPLCIATSLSITAPVQQPSPPESASSALLARYADGAYGDAEAIARPLTIAYPSTALFWKVLGAALWQQGKTDDSLGPMYRAVELTPGDVDALCNLGAALEDHGLPKEAERLYRQALAIAPDHVTTLSNLGDTLRQQHKLVEAQSLLERALSIQPDNDKAHNNLGCVLRMNGQLDAALDHLNRALKISPDYPEALINLANVRQDKNQLLDAEQALRQSLALNPSNCTALNNLGNLLTLMGKVDDAESMLRRALIIKPDYFDAFSNLLFTLNYNDHGTPDERLAEARRFGQLIAGKATPFSTWALDEHPQKLRIGLVSGDLRQHPVGFFLDSIVAHLAALKLDLIAYPTQGREDDLTRRLRDACHQWHPLCGLDDQDAASLIRQDGIHILIDLAGHTAFNRLPMFAYKPAPIQVSWLGYFATTGVAQIDYLLADPLSVPEQNQTHFSEAIRYLPDTRLCFSEPGSALDVGELPALKNGRLTFGNFQNLAKASDRVLGVWARIMAALPDSRLRWQCKQFSDPALVVGTMARLERNGIARHRVTLHGPTPRETYLAAHHEIDLILDTFPYTGGTTTCEALWMGVPTITLAGDSMHSRQGASLMNAAGLPDWIASNEDDYVRMALSLNNDIDHLAALRTRLRLQVKQSPLFDAKRFANQLETALWAMWEHYTLKPESLRT
jgi:protein O-GlcNAc transferase